MDKNYVPNTLLVSFKEGAVPDKVLTGMDTGRGLRYERVIDISKDVEKYKKTNLGKGLDKLSDEDVFCEMYEDLKDYEKKIYNIFRVTIENDQDIEALKDSLSKNAAVEYVQYDYINVPCMEPNDPDYPRQSNLRKIHCDAAWDKAMGDNIVIAVLDTGVDHSHPDLKNNMWQDSSGNYGYNFSDHNEVTTDYDGHGTHVAGIIGGEGNNSINIIGVAPKAKIMPVRIFPNFTDSIALEAFKYAVDNGAKILNNSWEPLVIQPHNHVLESAVDYAHGKGRIVVFAAGNKNVDISGFSPMNHPKVITVAATDENDHKSDFSNYGVTTVGAPGSLIYSLIPGNNTGFKSGTSMACAHVSGIIALMLVIDNTLSFEKIREILTSSGTRLPLQEKIPVRVDAYSALLAIPVPCLV